MSRLRNKHNKEMNKVEIYEKDWISFTDELKEVILEYIIEENFKFFRECWETGIPPKRSIALLL